MGTSIKFFDRFGEIHSVFLLCDRIRLLQSNKHSLQILCEVAGFDEKDQDKYSRFYEKFHPSDP